MSLKCRKTASAGFLITNMMFSSRPYMVLCISRLPRCLPQLWIQSTAFTKKKRRSHILRVFIERPAWTRALFHAPKQQTGPIFTTAMCRHAGHGANPEQECDTDFLGTTGRRREAQLAHKQEMSGAGAQWGFLRPPPPPCASPPLPPHRTTPHLLSNLSKPRFSSCSPR